MARPVAANAEATRARILDAACVLVAEHGIEGTSIRDVAGASKVSLGTVLHYFGSKEGLHDACISAMDAEARTMGPSLLATVKPSADADAVIGSAVRAAWTFVRTHRVAHLILLRASLDRGGMTAERRETVLRPFLDDISSTLAPFTGKPELHVRMSAHTFIQLLIRYALHSPAELRLVTNTTTDATAIRTTEDHLIAVAHALFVK